MLRVGGGRQKPFWVFRIHGNVAGNHTGVTRFLVYFETLTYVRTYLLTYFPTYLLMYLLTYILTYLLIQVQLGDVFAMMKSESVCEGAKKTPTPL